MLNFRLLKTLYSFAVREFVSCNMNGMVSSYLHVNKLKFNVSMYTFTQLFWVWRQRNTEEGLNSLVCMNIECICLIGVACKKSFNLIHKQSKRFYWNEIVTLSKCRVLMISYFIFVVKEKLQLFNLIFPFHSEDFFFQNAWVLCVITPLTFITLKYETVEMMIQKLFSLPALSELWLFK